MQSSNTTGRVSFTEVSACKELIQNRNKVFLCNGSGWGRGGKEGREEDCRWGWCVEERCGGKRRQRTVCVGG